MGILPELFDRPIESPDGRVIGDRRRAAPRVAYSEGVQTEQGEAVPTPPDADFWRKKSPEDATRYSSRRLTRSEWQPHADAMHAQILNGQPDIAHHQMILADRMQEVGDPREELLRRSVLQLGKDWHAIPEQVRFGTERPPHTGGYTPPFEQWYAMGHFHDPADPDNGHYIVEPRVSGPQSYTNLPPDHVRLTWASPTSNYLPVNHHAEYPPTEAREVIGRTFPEHTRAEALRYLDAFFGPDGRGRHPPQPDLSVLNSRVPYSYPRAPKPGIAIGPKRYSPGQYVPRERVGTKPDGGVIYSPRGWQTAQGENLPKPPEIEVGGPPVNYTPPAKYVHPSYFPQPGQYPVALSPEHHDFAAKALRDHQVDGDSLGWGALGDALADAGHPGAGQVFAKIAAGDPDAHYADATPDDARARLVLDRGRPRGHMHFRIIRDGSDLVHMTDMNLHDRHWRFFWRERKGRKDQPADPNAPIQPSARLTPNSRGTTPTNYALGLVQIVLDALGPDWELSPPTVVRQRVEGVLREMGIASLAQLPYTDRAALEALVGGFGF